MPAIPTPDSTDVLAPIDAEAFRAKYGPWAVVAGGAEGMGAQYCEQLAALGLDLVVFDRNESALRATALRIGTAAGVRVRTEVLDLVAPEQELVEVITRATDGLDLGLFVANAAWSPVGPFLDVTLESNLAALAINCRAPVVFSHVIGRRLRDRGRGGIVIMSSMAAESGTANLAVYSGTKAFDLNFAETLWIELRDHGVDVVAVRPGSTRTPGWVRSQPEGSDEPAADPADVVAEALARLGTTPSFVAGEANRIGEAYFRSLTRPQVVEIMSRTTGVLVGDS